MHLTELLGVIIKKEICAEIKRLSKKAFNKQREKDESTAKYAVKFTKRTGLPAGITTAKAPSYSHQHFSPVHCKRHANGISKAIWDKVLKYEYEPLPAVRHLLPKPDGSKREIMAFSIPDAAVANVLLRKALDRNKKRLSPHSYAYHPDKNLFDAIIALKDFECEGKLFVVQIDFEKFFDKIPSAYIKSKLDDASVLSLTPHEKHIFKAFLHHKYADRSAYAAMAFKRRFKGTPQGASASLILANVANHDLDRKLASESGRFVRFADDVVAVCKSYEHAQAIERCFNQHCSSSGLVINAKKSPGISILAEHTHEIRTIDQFVYLGYGFSEHGLYMPEKTLTKLKQKISRLINIYLFSALKYGFNHSRASKIGKFDWDLLGLIYEIRRGLYGGLQEKDLHDFLYQGHQLKSMRGLMGFYCLIEHPRTLKELDGWMVNAIRRACVQRDRILMRSYERSCPTPSDVQLIRGTWLDLTAWRTAGDEENEPPEVKLPSLVRGWRAARKHYFTHGLEGVQSPGYQSSSDVAELFDFFGY